VVFSAGPARLHRRVALKSLPPRRPRAPTRAGLLREARAAISATHGPLERVTAAAGRPTSDSTTALARSFSAAVARDDDDLSRIPGVGGGARRKTREGQTMPTEHHADVVIGAAGGACRVTREPARIAARPDDEIAWQVQNTCTRAVSVELARFRYESREEDDPTIGWKHAKVPANGSIEIRGRVKHNARKGLYTYDVMVNEQLAADPEILIDSL
jgi:hypothetical protein